MDTSAIAATDAASSLLATQNRTDADANGAAQQQAAAARSDTGTAQSVPAVSQGARRLVDIFV